MKEFLAVSILITIYISTMYKGNKVSNDYFGVEWIHHFVQHDGKNSKERAGIEPAPTL
jgi:hypothetical protein